MNLTIVVVYSTQAPCWPTKMDCQQENYICCNGVCVVNGTSCTPNQYSNQINFNREVNRMIAPHVMEMFDQAQDNK